MAKYPLIPPGTTLTTGLLASLLSDVATKTAAEAITNNTMQNDDELFLSVEANATYDVLLHLYHDSATAGDLLIGWSGPSGATMNWGMIGAQVTTTSSTTVTDVTMPQLTIAQTNALGGGPSAGTYCLVHGTLITAGTAGTLNFRWAQNATNATASNVRAGSQLIVRRTA